MSASTSNRSYPYPQLTDSVDPPGDIEALAEAVDTDVQAVDDKAASLAPMYVQRTSDASAITGTTLTSVMSFTIPQTGTYVFDGLITLTNTSAVGQPGFGFGGTCTTSAWRWAGATIHFNSATATQGSVSASGTTAPTSGSSIVASDFTTTTGFSSFHVKGSFTVSATGTWTVCFSEAVGSGTVNVKSGSMVTVQYTGS